MTCRCHVSLDSELAFVVERGNQREASAAEIEDPRSFRQELNGRLLPRLQVASDSQIRDPEDMSDTLTANGHLDQRRSPLPVHGDHRWFTSLVFRHHCE